MKSILIIRFSSLGDILLTTPLLRVLKKKYPDAQADYVVKPEYASLISGSPHINRVIRFSKETASDLKQQIAAAGYDMIIDLQNNPRSRRLTSGLSAPVHRFKKHSIKKWLLVNFKINRLDGLPPIPERYIFSVPELEPDGQGLEFLFTPVDVPLERGKKYIAVAPGSRHFTKMWGENRFIELNRALVRDGFTPVLLGGKDDFSLCCRIADAVPESVNLSGDHPIEYAATALTYCRAAVCNDSGLMHLSCSVQVPVLVFFGSTVRHFGFIPYKNKSVIMENNTLACRPCSHIGRASCPKGHFLCMTELKPSDALAHLKHLAEA
ncbi:MAG: ADP-heptose--LPS heptosyltransferase 2 [Ignavibacteriaceae bacterium]|nr:ADP-heptose--LPS heptosyltransferase 2 [Ignavibacteriaceae bacterium]